MKEERVVSLWSPKGGYTMPKGQISRHLCEKQLRLALLADRWWRGDMIRHQGK